MDFPEDRLKNNNRKLVKYPSLPLIYLKNNQLYKFKAKFDGFSVIISDPDDIFKLHSMGIFGKSCLSRSKPFKDPQRTEILRERQLKNRKQIQNNAGKAKSVIVVADSDEEDAKTASEIIKPRFEIDKSGNLECLHLTLEEAFFLQKINCLEIASEAGVLNEQQLFKEFCESDEYFWQNYLVFHYFRSKNWIVKPGLKFGGDYVLYKADPSYIHATYVVIIENLDGNLQRMHRKNRRSMKMQNILGLNRLCETAAKDLLIAQIIWPENPSEAFEMTEFSIQEVLLKRWLFNERSI